MFEFSIVLPLVSLLLFGIVQYGLIFGAYSTLKAASASAARYALLSSPKPLPPQVEAYARNAIQPGLELANLDAPIVTNETVGGVGGAKGVELVYRVPVFFTVPGTSAGRFVVRVKTIMR